MSKLTAQEIIEILEEREGITTEEFAFDDINAPEDFVGSVETEEIRATKDTANQKLKEAEEGLDWQQRRNDPVVKELREKFYSLPTYHDLLRNEWLESIGVGKIEEVSQYGGEGQGDTWYSVKYFPKHDVYIRTDGFYSSYNGVDFYEGYGKEVRPVKKTITVYEFKETE